MPVFGPTDQARLLTHFVHADDNAHVQGEAWKFFHAPAARPLSTALYKARLLQVKSQAPVQSSFAPRPSPVPTTVMLAPQMHMARQAPSMAYVRTARLAHFAPPMPTAVHAVAAAPMPSAVLAAPIPAAVPAAYVPTQEAPASPPPRRHIPDAEASTPALRDPTSPPSAESGISDASPCTKKFIKNLKRNLDTLKTISVSDLTGDKGVDELADRLRELVVSSSSEVEAQAKVIALSKPFRGSPPVFFATKHVADLLSQVVVLKGEERYRFVVEEMQEVATGTLENYNYYSLGKFGFYSFAQNMKQRAAYAEKVGQAAHLSKIRADAACMRLVRTMPKQMEQSMQTPKKRKEEENSAVVLGKRTKGKESASTVSACGSRDVIDTSLWCSPEARGGPVRARPEGIPPVDLESP